MSDTAFFFELTSKALSEASSNRQFYLKSGDKASAEMWSKFHHLLTHAHAGMHEPQRIRNDLQAK